MEIEDANSLQLSVTTDCCRDVVFTMTSSTIYEYNSRRRLDLNLPENTDITAVHHTLVTSGVSKRDMSDGEYYIDFEHRALPRHMDMSSIFLSSTTQWNTTQNPRQAWKDNHFDGVTQALTSRMTTSVTGTRRRLTSVNLEDYFEFQLQLLPSTGSVAIYPPLVLHRLRGTDVVSARVSSSNCYTTPSSFTFTSASTNAGKGRFVIRCSSGCYCHSPHGGLSRWS